MPLCITTIVTSNFGMIYVHSLHLYIYMHIYDAGWANWGSTTYTSHKHVSCTKTLSWHQRMNLQHADVSLARLHTNKPAGTRKLTPTPAYFNIVPACTIRTKSQKNVFILIGECWKRSHHICVNSECLCSKAIPLYKQWSFLHVWIN